MKNHTLQVRVTGQTELRLRNYQLREKRDRSDALRRLIEDALDLEELKAQGPDAAARTIMNPADIAAWEEENRALADATGEYFAEEVE